MGKPHEKENRHGELEIDLEGQKRNLGIREYRPEDRPAIVRGMEQLWDHLSALDEFGRMIRKPEYGEVFTQKLFDEIGQNGGIIYVATDKETVIGFVACVMVRQTEDDQLRAVPLVDGRVSKLYIDQEYRDRRVGTALMKRAEEFFKDAGCDLVRAEVFSPNVGAHEFYKGLGYTDRVIDMVKKTLK